MRGLVKDMLNNRYPDQRVSMEEAAGVFADIIRDPTQTHFAMLCIEG